MRKFTFEKFYLYYNLFCYQLVKLLIILEGAVLSAILVQNFIRTDVRYFTDQHFYSNIMKFSQDLFWVLVVIAFFRLMKNLLFGERQKETLYEASDSSVYQFFRVISDLNPLKGILLPTLMVFLYTLPDVPNKYSFILGLDGFVPQTVTEKNFAQFYHTMEKTYSGNENVVLSLSFSLLILLVALKLIGWAINQVVFEVDNYDSRFAFLGTKGLRGEIFKRYSDSTVTTQDFNTFVREHFLKEEVQDSIVVDVTYVSGYRKGAYFTQTMTINFYSKLGHYISTIRVFDADSYPKTVIKKITPSLALEREYPSIVAVPEKETPTEPVKDMEVSSETNQEVSHPTETTSAVIHKTETVSGFAQVSPEFVTEKSLRLKQFQRGGFSQMRGRLVRKRNNKKRTE